MTPVARNFSVLLLICIGLTTRVVEAGAAVGTVDLSWNACSPVVATLSRGAPGPISMYASVVGHDEPHNGYRLTVFVLPTPVAAVPDAWRFDAAGCQGPSSINLQHFPMGAISKACPAFQQAATGAGGASYQFDPLVSWYASIVAWNFYSPGVSSVDPARRYFLMSATFDHTFSVVGSGTPGATCGGFERDMVVTFTTPPCTWPGCSGDNVPHWIDAQNIERDLLIGQGSLTFCGTCGPTPAAPTTWGAIKGQYRR